METATIIHVTREEMRTANALKRSVSWMRSKNNPKFNRAIDKDHSLRQDYIKSIAIRKAA